MLVLIAGLPGLLCGQDATEEIRPLILAISDCQPYLVKCQQEKTTIRVDSLEFSVDAEFGNGQYGVVFTCESTKEYIIFKWKMEKEYIILGRKFGKAGFKLLSVTYSQGCRLSDDCPEVNSVVLGLQNGRELYLKSDPKGLFLISAWPYEIPFSPAEPKDVTTITGKINGIITALMPMTNTMETQ